MVPAPRTEMMIPIGSIVEVKRHPGWGEGEVKSHWRVGGVVKNFIHFRCNFAWFYDDSELVIILDETSARDRCGNCLVSCPIREIPRRP
jgi:hypothetical protein